MNDLISTHQSSSAALNNMPDIQTPVFSAATLERIDTIIKRYPAGKQKSALIPLLHLAQEEFGGWLNQASMDYVAGLLNIRPVEVYEVASFYSMFYLKPVGKHVLEVCHTGPCCLNGAEKMVSHLKKELKIEVGETTPNGLFTLKTVECLASCGSAPMMQIGMYYYENLTPDKVSRILEELKLQHK